MIKQLQRSKNEMAQTDKLGKYVRFLIPNRLADSSLHCFHFYNLEQSTRTVAHVRDDRALAL